MTLTVERISLPSLHYQKHMTGVCKHQGGPSTGFVVEGESPKNTCVVFFGLESPHVLEDGVVVLGEVEEPESVVVHSERVVNTRISVIRCRMLGIDRAHLESHAFQTRRQNNTLD